VLNSRSINKLKIKNGFKKAQLLRTLATKKKNENTNNKLREFINKISVNGNANE
jgi:hypothetical protein